MRGGREYAAGNRSSGKRDDCGSESHTEKT